MDTANPASSAARDPEPSYGPDEEGEIPLDRDEIPDADDKPGAWVKEEDGHPEEAAMRPGGGEAAGGAAAQAGDPTSPAMAAQRAEASDRAMAERGFGDHKGTKLDASE
jgi:hypothetical protein